MSELLKIANDAYEAHYAPNGNDAPSIPFGTEKTAGPMALGIEQFARKLDHMMQGMRGVTGKKLLEQRRLQKRILQGSQQMERAMSAIPAESLK